MKRLKFNYVKFSIFVLIVVSIIVGIIIGIVSLVKHVNYTKTYEYKLLEAGYNIDEVKLIESKLNDKQKDYAITRKYDEESISLLSEKYFIYAKWEEYIDYKKKHSDIDNKKIVAIINSEANVEWLDTEKETDTSKGILMLVNRLYGLKEDFAVEDIVSVPTKYAYSGKKLSNVLMDDLIRMCDDAKEEGYTFVVSEGFRTYKEQKKIYNDYANNNSKSLADEFVARPGHSEYETGLSFDLEPYNKVYKNPLESEEYKWLKENAHNYGFIFRFLSDKEDLTGFSADTWRLRYVGVDAATMIYNEDICFEEYYAYFVRGDK